MAPVPCQKVMSNSFQVYKRIVIFYKFKQFYRALLMGMVHNKEVHGVVLKRKMETAEFSATVRMAAHPQP